MHIPVSNQDAYFRMLERLYL